VNSIIILPSELDGPIAVIRGNRAAYVNAWHDLKENIQIRASLFGGNRGTARVIGVNDNEIKLEVEFNIAPLERKPIDLFVAISRPQTVKKVLHIASALGVNSLTFFRCAHVQRSYLDSKVLKDENIKEELIKGLEQAYDSIPPAVQVVSSFKELSDQILALYQGANINDGICRIVASCELGLPNLKQALHKRVPPSRYLLVVGPELGLTEEELTAFKLLGFLPITLDERILRVEIALNYLLGVITFFSKT